MNEQSATCKSCDKTAQVYISYVGNGKLLTEAYCKLHAREAGLLDNPAWDLLGDSKSQGLVEYNMLTCERCGHTQREFERSGRLGCPACYDTFKHYLNPILKRIHRQTLHIGKMPTKAITSSLAGNRIKILEEQMRMAVNKERYEEAARYRDEITEMKSYTIPKQEYPIS